MAANTHDTGRILDRIAKLLALAGNNPSQEEASAAAARAAELMLKYNVEAHELDGRLDAPKTEVGYKVYDIAQAGGGNINWRRLLFFGVARNNFCKSIIIRSRGKSHTMGIVGEAHNIVFVEYLFDYLADAFWNEAHTTFIRMKYREGRQMINGNTWKDSFCMGAMAAVVDRLNADRKKAAQDDAKINALIIVQDKLVTEEYAKLFPRVGQTWTGNTNRGNDAEARGKEFGKNVSLNRPIPAGSRREAPLQLGG